MGKVKHVNQNTGEIVLSAVKKLTKNTGWTVRTIVKFIKLEYSMTDNNISRKVSRALKRGVRLGLLQIDRGRYRLTDMCGLARPVSSGDVRTRRTRNAGQRQKPLRIRSRSPPHKRSRCAKCYYIISRK